MLYELTVSEKGDFEIRDSKGNKIKYLKDSLNLVQDNGYCTVTVSLLCKVKTYQIDTNETH
ncbi:hypothetical protein [Parapedobacter indicus]|uniref:Uncharacterized protein n=1 Tax=Parapedobacter indicus TaxID=1477437 RepID=A0A1I3V0X4_9SPHI|nr:hypothetical protein [Parapedobacter indicus]PPK98991.1 hypothetical protein CLV26_11520 [Parapedobacter indicus]SFJ89324.1 hypothetical protein SAMN05444682_115157 [Parapedobacter indicus]